MYTLCRVSGYRYVEIKDHSIHCHNKQDKYNILIFTNEKGVRAEIELFFDHNTVYRVSVEMVKNDTGRGPYKLVRNDEDVYVFVDWHYEQPDDYIVIDAVYLDGEQIDGTEEENQDLIEQIYNWELFR